MALRARRFVAGSRYASVTLQMTHCPKAEPAQIYQIQGSFAELPLVLVPPCQLQSCPVKEFSVPSSIRRHKD